MFVVLTENYLYLIFFLVILSCVLWVDGDLDLGIKATSYTAHPELLKRYDSIQYHENTGTLKNPIFTQQSGTNNPFANVIVTWDGSTALNHLFAFDMDNGEYVLTVSNCDLFEVY